MSELAARPARFGPNAAGVLWVTAGTAIFSLVFASGKLAGPEVSALQILCLRYLGGLLTLGAILAARREGPASLRSSRPLTHLARAACGGFGGAAAIYAASAMPIADATAIGLTDGAFLVLLGILVLGERVGRAHWVAIALCCLGAAVIMAERGAFARADLLASLLPAGAALLGALLIAFEGLLIKVLSVAERPLAVLAHVNLFGFLLLLGPAIWAWSETGLLANLPFLLLGPLAITGQYCNIRGFRLAPVSLLGPVGYSWLLFATLIGLVGFGEVPGPATWAGALLILLGGIALARLPEPKDIPESKGAGPAGPAP